MIEGFPKRPRNIDFEARKFTLEEARFIGSHSGLVSLGFKNCPIGDDHIAELRSLTKLVRIWLEGTAITDASLEHLALLPKLEFLILDRTQITGTGLRFFHEHNGLKSLWASGTPITDETVQLAASIPKLSILRIADTAVSFQGILSLATNSKLKVNAGDKFSPEQMLEYEALQRNLARNRRCTVEDSEEDLAAAKATLLSFFQAMIDWESSMAEADTKAESFGAEADFRKHYADGQLRCQAIFDKYCTTKPRKYGRPSVLSYSKPSQYAQEEIVDVEQPTRQKVLIYTKDQSRFQRRYLMIKRDGEWRIDHRECLMDRWSRDFL